MIVQQIRVRVGADLIRKIRIGQDRFLSGSFTSLDDKQKNFNVKLKYMDQNWVGPKQWGQQTKFLSDHSTQV